MSDINEEPTLNSDINDDERTQGRLMIAKVYHFLKEEFAFTELFKEPNCDITHLRNITLRTAEATGVSERTVQKILKEERDMKDKGESGSKCTKKELKEKKDVKETEDSASKSTSSSAQEEKLSSTSKTDSANKIISEEKEKRRVVHSEGREMIASIYYFLKGEYEVTDLYREPNTDYTHLRNITRRTAEAAGVSERTVQKILKEERDLLKSGGADAASKNTKKATKKATAKKVKNEKENKTGKKRTTKRGEAGKSTKNTKKRGKKDKNEQNTNDASTSSTLPPVETNINPQPDPSLLLPPPIYQ